MAFFQGSLSRESLHMKLKSYIGPALALLGVGFMAAGVWRGELEIIFSKAIRVCLECIGIG